MGPVGAHKLEVLWERQIFRILPQLGAACSCHVSAMSRHFLPSLLVSVVPDLTLDPRFCDRPYISEPPFNRFYAGIPLVSGTGISYGAICVFDSSPRSRLQTQRTQFNAHDFLLRSQNTNHTRTVEPIFHP